MATKTSYLRLAFLASTILVLTTLASANAVTYSGSSGGRSASATFDLTGNTLTVSLVNTSLGDVHDATDILLAVLFNTSSTLTPVSASIDGSTVFGSFVNDVGEGWQYKSGVSAHGKNSGISGAGYGVFGPSGNFFSPALIWMAPITALRQPATPTMETLRSRTPSSRMKSISL